MEEKKNLFAIYKETNNKLRRAKEDLRYWRFQLNKCVPSPVYEKDYQYLTRKIVKTGFFIKQMTTLIDLLNYEIEDHIKKYDDIKYKVFKGYYIENKTLLELSNELGYSYGYIREISSKLRKE